MQSFFTTLLDQMVDSELTAHICKQSKLRDESFILSGGGRGGGGSGTFPFASTFFYLPPEAETFL